MGFLANAAAKSEIKVRDQVLSLVRAARPDFAVGSVLLPCHIVDEAHNGFFVDTGAIALGVFRCQLHWWGHELDANTLAGLRSPDSAAWMRSVGSSLPKDLGSIRGGVDEFAAGLAFGLPHQSTGATPDSIPFPQAQDDASGEVPTIHEEDWMPVLRNVRKTAEHVMSSDTRDVTIAGENVGFSMRLTPGMRVRFYWDVDNTYTTSFVVGGQIVDIMANHPPLTPVRATAVFIARCISELLRIRTGTHDRWSGLNEAVEVVYPEDSITSGIAALDRDLDQAVRSLVSLSIVVRDDGKASRVVLGPAERKLLRWYAGSVGLGAGLANLVPLIDELDHDDIGVDAIDGPPSGPDSGESSNHASMSGLPLLIVDSVKRYLEDQKLVRNLGHLYDETSNVVGLEFTIAESGRVWFSAINDELRVSIHAGDLVLRIYEVELPHHFLYYVAEILDDVCRFFLDILEGEDSTGVPDLERALLPDSAMASLYPSTSQSARDSKVSEELSMDIAILSVLLEVVHMNAYEDEIPIEDYVHTFRRFARRFPTAGPLRSMPEILLHYGVEL